MIITIDTEKNISQTDILLLAHLVAAHDAGKSAAANGWVPDPEEPGAVIKETDASTAEKPEQAEPEKPKRKRRTKAEMEAARAAEAAEKVETDVQLDDSDEDGEPEAAPVDPPAPAKSRAADVPKTTSETVIEKYRAEAVERATAMVADGDRAAVVAALESVGAKKVSQIADDKLAAFLGALAA